MTTNQSSAANNTGAVGSVGINNAVTQLTAAPLKAATGFRLQLQQVLAGVQAVLPDGSSLVGVSGVALAKADIVRTLNGSMAAYTAIDGLLTSLSQARKQLESGLPATQSYYEMLRAALSNFLGTSSPVLAQFGLAPKKPRKALTSLAIVAAAAKAKETRKLRHTLGAKQKAKLQFTGQVAVSTQVNAPAQAGAVTTVAPAAVAVASGPATTVVAAPAVSGGLVSTTAVTS